MGVQKLSKAVKICQSYWQMFAATFSMLHSVYYIAGKVVFVRMIYGGTLLLMKLAGSTWGASANNLQSSALALCYSVAEYCAPVWSRSAHKKSGRCAVGLYHAPRLWYRTLRSTPLPWLPVLSNIEPPALRRKAATDKLVEKKSSNMTVG